MYDLSHREIKILEMLSAGMSEPEIAEALMLSSEEYQRSYNALAEKIDWKEPQTLEGKTQALVFERARAASLVAALHASETRLRALMDLSQDAIVIADGKSGKIKQVNDRCEDLFGYTRRELIGMEVEQLVEPEIREKHIKLRQGFLRSIRKREIGYHPPIFALRKDGQLVELVIGLTSTANSDDVMVICTEYARTIAGQPRAAT